MTIAEKVKDLRIKRNWRQEYVANELEISQSTYSALENGTSKLTIERAEALAELHGIDPTYFFSKTEVHINVGIGTFSNSGVVNQINNIADTPPNACNQLVTELIETNRKQSNLILNEIKILRKDREDLVSLLTDLQLKFKKAYIWALSETNTNMARNLVLETLLENYKETIEEVADKTEIHPQILEGLLSGKERMKIPYAEKLGDYFKVDAELFFREQAETLHLNHGEGSISNSGFIKNENGGNIGYINKPDEKTVMRLEIENKQLKAKLAKLEKQVVEKESKKQLPS